MASAYAALVSFMDVLTRIQHPTSPVSVDKLLAQTLSQKLHFLVEFLENYHRKSSKHLLTNMSDAAFVAQHRIETLVADQVLARSAGRRGMGDTLLSLYLQKAIQEIDLIVQEAMEIKFKNDACNYLPTSSEQIGSSSLPCIGTSVKMVGLDTELIHLLELLATDECSRKIISIAGMGGIGKTTLATNVYNHPYIKQHFQIRASVVISHDYSVEKIIRSLLSDIGVDDVDQITDDRLGELLYKGLYGRMYLILLDDVWDTVVWDKIRRFFPDNNNGSRVLLTTRLLGVARSVSLGSVYEMKFLSDDQSWGLLRETIFKLEACPPGFERLGIEIARSCKGLPLAIVVVGGLLKMAEKTLEYWKDVAKNVNSIVYKDNGGYYVEILSLSYDHLPIHLKPCFLYLATFQGNDQIYVTDLIKLWVAEGFLRPIEGRSLEDVAEEYLQDLIDRNLVMVVRKSLNGQMESCRVHDSLREFCLKEAQVEKFLSLVEDENCTENVENERRLVYNHGQSNHSLQLTPYERSLVHNSWVSPAYASDYRSPRVLRASQHSELCMDIAQLMNVRFARIECQPYVLPELSSISFMWNLETLIVGGKSWRKLILPSEIWDLPYLTHLMSMSSTEVVLPDPTQAQISCNRKTLLTLCTKNFICSDMVLQMIPNLKEFSTSYDADIAVLKYSEMSRSFDNLAQIGKLEKLSVEFSRELTSLAHCLELQHIKKKFKDVFKEPENITFSPSLKELELAGSFIPWENMTIVGSLPNLEVLKLSEEAFSGTVWSPVEGEFQCLKCLSISNCSLKIWIADSFHFPRLEHLILWMLPLKQIPLGLSDIIPLELIHLHTEEISAVISANEVLKERSYQGNEDLVIRGCYYAKSRQELNEMEEPASDSFQIEFEFSWVTKLQKVYRGYRTRRMIADAAVVVEDLCWKALDYARSNQSMELARSRWTAVISNKSKGKGLSNDAKAEKLAFQKWLEAVDPKHRYGHNLHHYYDVWCKSDAGQRFFYWLDIGDGRDVDLCECPRSTLRQQCVMYLGPKEREQYEFVVIDGKFLHKLTGYHLDTNNIQSLGSNWIFVMSTSKKLYIGQKKKGFFYHSSFLSGGAPLAAGRLEASDGVLKSISLNSAEYDRNGSFDTFMSVLEEIGVSLDEVEITEANEDYDTNENVNRRIPSSTLDFVSSNVLDEEKCGSSETRVACKPEEAEVEYKMGLSDFPRADVLKTAILERMNSKKSRKSYQLGNQLPMTWATGAGPRLGCISDYPVELRLQALELTNLSRPHIAALLSPSGCPSTLDGQND